MTAPELIGWDRLRHGGLLLDPERQRRLAVHQPEPLPEFFERDLRRQAAAVLIDERADVPEFVAFVVQKLCGFSNYNGTVLRGSQIGAEWSRADVAGESVRPRVLWRGAHGEILPVFLDDEKRLGIGRGRKKTSQVLQWLRAGDERLALVTNGRQWRLVFAGLDFDAWCEWDVDLWFEEGALSPQFTALRTLLSPKLWSSAEKGAPSALLQAIQDSRKGQAELSAILGERVREAVEVLVQAHGEPLSEHCKDVDPAEIYRAAVRVLMRMVVVLFAESRELLPRDNSLYHGSYGLGGLFEELEKIAHRGGNRLRRSHNAWPRIVSLFRLVHAGSHHPSLPVPAYGGELFAPAEVDARDGLSCALRVFEEACFELERELMPDADVHRILERLTRTRVKVRQGRSTTTVASPVDFSDLSSEYIGILYEGLLDFELKTAPAGDPIIFLAVGNQPALPLSRLEQMDDKALKALLEKMKDTSSGDDEESGEAEDAEPEAEEAAAPSEDEDADVSDDEADEESDGDERHSTRTRAETWARRAVLSGGMVPRLRGAATPEKQLAHEERVARKARQLVTRVVLPGERYLVRWGGTRKGSGTFYTRPGLAIPTVHRTLRPLAWNPPADADGKPDRMAPAHAWSPKKPEEILALKVCDPACGSGTFPVAALRFLTDSLYKSLHHHGRISSDGDRGVVRLLEGPPAQDVVPEERLGDELRPCRPEDAFFEPRLNAILRRHVVERCIYGVDLDPLAVELCRLALWIETMDRSLPFSFLDHKVKCGNGLVGAWFDQFQHYPVMAWKNREGGDKGHSNGVHFEKDARGDALKVFARESLARDAVHFFQQSALFDPAVQKRALETHAHTLATLSKLHDLPVQDTAERARIYRDEFAGSAGYRSLKDAMDLWCACWFWPADLLDDAPLPSHLAAPSDAARDLAREISARLRFFHWELEFPDVFRASGSGFDAILGNPPWDIAKPSSKEFFSNLDPLYRSYGKQEALAYQTRYFEDEAVEREWLDYSADFRAQSNFMGYAANAYGDRLSNESSQDRFTIVRGKENLTLHARWRATRQKSQGFADASHPFRHQGSADLNLYKLFLEQAHALLRVGGRLGFIVPSGLYSDHGTGGLRALFLDRCRWEWLFGFENRDGIFEIHRSFKFNPIVIEKGGATEAIQTAFMRRKLEDWERAESLATPYTRAQVDRFSPRSMAILEIQSKRDLEILEKIYAHSVLFADQTNAGWGIRCGREFHMSDDVALFPSRVKWEAKGYQPDEYSRWLHATWSPIADLPAHLVAPEVRSTSGLAQPPHDRLSVPRSALPPGVILARDGATWTTEDRVQGIALAFMQGAMIHQFDFSYSGWLSGTGLLAKWEALSWDDKQLRPQYLMDIHDCMSNSSRLLYRRVARSTDARTMIAALDAGHPAGDKVPVVTTGRVSKDLCLLAALNSFVADSVLRTRLGSTNIDLSSVEELPLPSPDCPVWPLLATVVMKLNAGSRAFAPVSIRAASESELPASALHMAWRWRLTASERIRTRCILDAVLACLYRLTSAHVHHVLGECDLDLTALASRVTRDRLNPRGFWRVDKDKEPELRQTVLTLVAFQDLQERIVAVGGERDRGIEAFLTQNDGEGWLLPETLRLADYGLGHDDRAKEPHPVASRLGPRFYDWQLAQSPEESWRECHLHARNLLGKLGYLDLLANTLLDKPVSAWADALAHASDITATEDLIHIFASPLARFAADTWRSTLDDIGHLVTSRGLPFEASHRTQLVERALRITFGDRRQPALRATMELVSDVEVDAILTHLWAILEDDTETAWRKVIRASVDSQRFARLTSITPLGDGPTPPATSAGSSKAPHAASPKQASFFPDSKG